MFTSQERVKILFELLDDTFSLRTMRAEGILADITPLHDVYHLNGTKKDAMFASVIKSYKENVKQSDLEFVELVQKSKQSKQNLLHQLFDDLEDEAMDCDFLKKALVDKCQSLTLKNLLGFPIRPLKNYFGEKIALYFTFLKFHVKMLIVPGILAFII